MHAEQRSVPSFPPPIGPSSPAQICAVGANSLTTDVNHPATMHMQSVMLHRLLRVQVVLNMSGESSDDLKGIVLTDLRKPTVQARRRVEVAFAWGIVDMVSDRVQQRYPI